MGHHLMAHHHLWHHLHVMVDIHTMTDYIMEDHHIMTDIPHIMVLHHVVAGYHHMVGLHAVIDSLHTMEKPILTDILVDLHQVDRLHITADHQYHRTDFSHTLVDQHMPHIPGPHKVLLFRFQSILPRTMTHPKVMSDGASIGSWGYFGIVG